jgi:anti-sigma factor ChrR (cupin superfamily)
MSSLATAIVSSIVSAILNAPADTSASQQAVSAPSVMRAFPANVYPGALLAAPAMGQVIINNRALPTAPGLQIRNESNRIVLPSMLVGANFPVLYQMDAGGVNVWRIWILTPAEIAAIQSQ